MASRQTGKLYFYLDLAKIALAVDSYLVVGTLTWAYGEQRFACERSPQIKTYGDIIRRHQDEHAVDHLTGALEMLGETGDMQLGLHRFLRQSAPTA